MFSICLVRKLAIFCIAASIAASAAAWPHQREQEAEVRLLATSTFIRGTWGLNLDVYLAEIAPQKGSERELVRLIDEYLNSDPPLSAGAPTSAVGTTLRIRRDQQCDMPFARLQLRTAPGDPMAILPERLSYRPQLPRTPGPDETLPCYRILRR